MRTATLTGRLVHLRPATMADRAMVHGWSYAPDVARWLHLSDPQAKAFDAWNEDWEDHYFLDGAPERGRMYVILRDDRPIGVIAHSDVDPRRRVEIDLWLASEAHFGRGFGPDAIEVLVGFLQAERGVRTFMMQPSARNPRAIRAYEKVGFVRVPATAAEIAADWGGVDHHDSVLMIREAPPAAAASPVAEQAAGRAGRVERLRAGDGARLRAIRLRALADAPAAFSSTLAEAEARAFEDWEAQVRALPTFVWSERGVDLGMARGAPHSGDAAAAYLLSMWVAPEARGRGIGAALAHEVMTWARAEGFRRLVLDVGVHNLPAQRMYERLGFTATGATPLTPACVHEMEMAMELRAPEDPESAP